MTSYPIPQSGPTPPPPLSHVLIASPSNRMRQRVLDKYATSVRRCEQVSGGAEALLHLESGSWQILFLDRRLHDLDAEELSHTVRQRYLRVGFECGLVSAEHLTYREFLQRVPEKTYLASVDLLPAGAVAVLQLDIAIAFPVIDVLLGGEGKPSDNARDITEIEEQVIEGIIRIMCRELQTTWQAIALEFKFAQRQPILQTHRLMLPEEKNLCLSFEIKMSEVRGTLNLAIPAVVSNALLRKISADFNYQRPRTSAEARLQIKKKLLNCFFPVELSISHLQVPAPTLSTLAPGDLLIFPVDSSAPAQMRVDTVQLCSANPVRTAGHRAARVVSTGTSLEEAR